MRPRSILVVEDDPKTSASIRLYLEHAGYPVVCVFDGTEALYSLSSSPPPLAVILDVMLPGHSGIQLCKSLRRHSDAPVLIVSARTEEPDRVLGFKAGADDYITKPFSPRELVARVRAVLRRSGPPDSGEIRLDHRGHGIDLRGTLIPLSPTELRVFKLFIEAPRRIFTRDDVIRIALDRDYDGLDRTVDVHIMNIRRKVRASGGPAQIIATVFGVGYKLGNVK